MKRKKLSMEMWAIRRIDGTFLRQDFDNEKPALFSRKIDANRLRLSDERVVKVRIEEI